MAQFLIHDAGMALAFLLAESLGIKDQPTFFMLCEKCKRAFAEYEEKADRLHRKVNP